MSRQYKEIPIQQFPSLKTNQQNGILKQIEKTLRIFIRQHHIGKRPVLIPSLSNLANHFRASQLNTLNALLLLRNHHYYFQIEGFNKPIKLWLNH